MKKRAGRKSIRLPEYDYSQAGAYFVTVSCYQKMDLFGFIDGEQVRLNELGLLTQQYWQSIPEHFNFVTLDAFIVMPNHIHGILFINEYESLSRRHPLNGQKSQARVGARHASPLPKPRGTSRGSLGAIVGAYKSSVTRTIRQLKHHASLQIWQRNYYERVIRNQAELEALRNYVEYNYLSPLSTRKSK
ncbi:MAG TPA: hypothetical protein PLC52_00365 [Anaerolineales bacterium]|nr:hypothetical protein [Anaerolineales bacterium]HRQ91306.1 hypothetical protein [Anaerolineales bacterium]